MKRILSTSLVLIILVSFFLAPQSTLALTFISSKTEGVRSSQSQFAQESTIFSDDFESYALGSFPASGGWELVFNGMGDQYQVVTDAYGVSPTKSLQLWGSPNDWSATVQKHFNSASRYIGYEVSMLISAVGYGGPGRVDYVGFFNREAYIWGKYYATVQFNHDIMDIITDDGKFLGTWTPGTWYAIKVLLDRDTNTYSVWINGQLKGNAFKTSNQDTNIIDAMSLQSDHPGVRDYFDDVRVFESSQSSNLSLTALTDKTVYRRQEIVFATTKLLLAQTPVIGATISLQVDFPNGTAWFLWANITDSEGTSTFQSLLPKVCPMGKYNVYVSAYKPGIGNASTTTQFTILNEPPKVIAVETLPGVVEQPTTVRIRANASDNEDGTNIKVKCIVAIPNGTAQEHTMLFDGAYFTFHYPVQSTDPTGTYRLLVEAEDSEGSLSAPFHSSFENSISITLGIVNVQVTDSKQNPIDSANLLLRKTDSYLVYNGTTNQDGKFSFLKVVAGTYILQTSANEFAQTSTQLRVFADTETNESLVLQALPILQGYVKSANDKPIQNATVEVWTTQKPAGEASTDANGAYQIIVSAEGTCQVTASAYGYAESSSDLSLQFETTTIANFTLSQNGAVEGQVKDSFSGQPIANASVYLGKQEYLGVGNSTDEYGNFTFSDVPSDNYLLLVAAFGYEANSTQVNVTSGESSYVVIWLAPTGDVNGTVRNSLTNEPIQGAQISLTDNGGRVLTTRLADQNGTYAFMSIPPAAYVLEAYASGYNSTSSLIIVNPYDTIQDDVYLTPNDIFVALTVSPILCSRGETVHFELTVTDSQNRSLADNITQAGIFLFGPNNESIKVPTSRIGESFVGDYQVPSTATLGIWTVLGNMTDINQNILKPVGLVGIADAFYITFASQKNSYVGAENAEFQATVARYGNLTKLLGQNEVDANLTITDKNGVTMASFPLAYNSGIFSGEQSLTAFGTGNYTAELTIKDQQGNMMTQSLTFQVVAGFSVTFDTDQPVYNRTQSIRLFGYAKQTGGTPIEQAQVLLSLEVKGFTRTFATLTDNSGYYEFTFKPSGFDAGNYTANVVVAENDLERNASLAFAVLGLMLAPPEQTVNMAVNSNKTLTFGIRDIGQSVLTELEAAAVSSDPSLNVTLAAQPSSILYPGSQSQVEFLLIANSSSPTVCIVDFSIRSLEGAVENGRIIAYLYPAIPVALVEPELVEVSMNPGSYYMKQVNITNIGYGQMTNVNLTTPSLGWVSLTASEFGSIDPGESKLFDLILQPSENLSIGVYSDEVDVLSNNYDMVPIYLVVTVTPNATGALIFNVQDDQGKTLTGAYVMLQYLEYYTDTLSGTTNATGALLFANLPTGQYNYVVSIEGYSTESDIVTIYPGEPLPVNVSLYTNMMDASFTVEPIQIQDQYFVTLNFTYQTEIPPPFLLPVPPVLDYYADRAYAYNNGYNMTQEFTILNTGLIAVSDITLQAVMEPNTTGYHLSFRDFGDAIMIDSIEGKTVTQVPVEVQVDPGIMITNLTDGLLGKILIQGTFTYFDKGSDIPKTATTKAEVLVHLFDAGQRRLCVNPPMITGFNLNGVFVIEPGTWPQRLKDVVITNCAPYENVSLNTIAVGGGITLTLGFEIDIGKMIGDVLAQDWTAPYKQIEELKKPYEFGFFVAYGVITKTGGLPGESLPVYEDWWGQINLGGGPLYSLLLQSVINHYKGQLQNETILGPHESAILQSESWSFSESDFEDLTPSGIFATMMSKLLNTKLELGLDFTEGAILFVYKWEYSANPEVGIVPIVLVDAYAPKISISFPIQPSGIGGGESGGGGIAGWQPPQIVYPSQPRRPIIRTVTPTIIEGVHETVKLSISQNATLERDAFLASLTMKNKLTSTPIKNVNVTLKIDYLNGSDASSNFYVTPANLQNINAIDGGGTLNAAQTASARWTIIPKPGAGGSDDNGIPYHVQAQISYTMNGTQYILNSTVEPITVMPQPLLVLDYYVPSQIKADTPFKLAVKVTNVGKGTAHNLIIDSAQPIIYENIAKLLVNFNILGSAVKGQQAGNSLRINFGDVPPGNSTIGYWIMTCSMDGQFINFTASFTHANELGGAETSLIKQPIGTHIITTEVMKDDVNFLFLIDANNDGTPDTLVDPIFAGNTPVVDVAYTVQYSGETMILLTQKYKNQWIWIETDDPFGNSVPIIMVSRSDGKTLNPANYWMANGKIYLVDDPAAEYTIFFENPLAGIIVFSPQNTTYYSNMVPLTFRLNESASWIGYSLDNQPNATISGNVTLTVGTGAHQVIVFADCISGKKYVSGAIYFSVCRPSVQSSSSGGNPTAVFTSNQPVCFKGNGFAPSTTYDIYVVDHVAEWFDGMPIPDRILGTAIHVTSDSSGNISTTTLWSPPLKTGTYDIIVDLDHNGIYNSTTDLRSSVTIESGLPIPEFWLGTISCLTGFLAAAGLFYLTRRRKQQPPSRQFPPSSSL